MTCEVCERQFRVHTDHRRRCCSEKCRREYNDARYVVKKRLSVAEAAYLAGLIDGEGTLSIWRERAPKNTLGFRNKTTFTISQASQPFLEEVRDMAANGTVALASYNARKNPRHKDGYILRFNAHQTMWVLPQVAPYLRRKSEQAQLVLAYYESLHDTGRRNGQEYRNELSRRAMELNRRGKPLPLESTSTPSDGAVGQGAN